MTFTIVKQFIPGDDKFWVASLGEHDPILSFTNKEEADSICSELNMSDTEGRKYKVNESTR